MSVIPDMPDDYEWMLESERTRIIDLGELAARLGSPATYDRRGEVLWMDAFHGGLGKWTVAASGGNSVIQTSVDRGLHSPYSIYMLHDGSTPSITTMTRTLSPPLLNRWGLEVAVAFLTTFDVFTIQFERYTGSIKYRSSIQIDCTDSAINIVDENSTWQKIADLPDITFLSPTYFPIKVVGDFSINEYVRVLFGSNEYDVSGNAFLTGESAVHLQNRIYLTFSGRDSHQDKIHIGHVIVTANEPL